MSSHFFPGIGFGTALLALIVWSFVWKGIALWKSARNSDKGWFIALLILNTAGILEIIYIYAIGNKKANTNAQTPVSQ